MTQQEFRETVMRIDTIPSDMRFSAIEIAMRLSDAERMQMLEGLQDASCNIEKICADMKHFSTHEKNFHRASLRVKDRYHHRLNKHKIVIDIEL